MNVASRTARSTLTRPKPAITTPTRLPQVGEINAYATQAGYGVHDDGRICVANALCAVMGVLAEARVRAWANALL